MIYTLLIAVLATLAYVSCGFVCWTILCSSAVTAEDHEVVISSKTTTLGRIGAAALVLTWPVWFALPKVLYYWPREAVAILLQRSAKTA